MLSILVPPAAGGFPSALALRQDSSGSSGSYHTAPGSPEPQGPRPVLDGADDDGGSGVPGRGQPAKFAGQNARVPGRGAGPAASGGSQLRLSISAQNSRQEPGSGFPKRPGQRPSPFQLRTLPSGEMEVIFTTGPLGGTPVQSPSDSDEADSEVQQLTELSLQNLSRPQGPYLDVHSPSAQASSSPSPAVSDCSNQADRWATYLDLRQEAESSASRLPELPDTSRRSQFECVEVALEDQASSTKQRTVPKRQIELRLKPSPPELDSAGANGVPRRKLFLRTGSLDESLTRLQAASNLVQTALARKLQAEQPLRPEQLSPGGGARPIQTPPGSQLRPACDTQKPADWPRAWPEARESEAPTRRTVRSPRRDSKELKPKGTSQARLPPREPAKEAPLPPGKSAGSRAPDGVVSIRVPRPWPSLRERAIRRDKPAPGTEPLGPVSSSIFLLSGEKSQEASESRPRNEWSQQPKSLSPRRTPEDRPRNEWSQQPKSLSPRRTPEDRVAQETPSLSPQETWDPAVQESLISSMQDTPTEALPETTSTQSTPELTVQGQHISPTGETTVPDTWEPRDAPTSSSRSRVTIPRPRDVRKLVKNTYSLSFPAAASSSLALPEPLFAPEGPSEESETPPGAPEPLATVHYTSTFQKDFLPVVTHPYEVPEPPAPGGVGVSDPAPLSSCGAPQGHQPPHPQPQPKGYEGGDPTPRRKAENNTAKPFARSEIRLPGALALSRKPGARAQPESSTEISRASPGYSPQAQRLLPEGEVQANSPGVTLGPPPISKEPRERPEVERHCPHQWPGTGQTPSSLTGSPHPNLRGSLHLGSSHSDQASSLALQAQSPEPRAKPQPGLAGTHPPGNQITAKPASLSQPRAASAPPMAQVLDSPSRGQGRGPRGSGTTPSGKVLVDPESGRYYYVEAPKSPRLKLLFDPESGQYLEVLVPPSPAGAPLRFYPSLPLGHSLYPSPYGSYPGLSLPPSPGPLPLGPPDLLAPGTKLPWAPEGGTVDGLYYLPTGNSPSPLPSLPLLLYSGPPNSGPSTATKGLPF
ncbi:proline-rich basic protein 1 [Dromiciops gliroides]|uniref:proline-rich basic protein 1 n=1 Tax=Dromiciops gliroides TaxID=33562 RepID=UPI001CC82CE0|nr:proline-rich basic protein 1 [Dromiciops gliroides]